MCSAAKCETAPLKLQRIEPKAAGAVAVNVALCPDCDFARCPGCKKPVLDRKARACPGCKRSL